MNRPYLRLKVLLVGLVVLCGCSRSGEKQLTVQGGDPVVYACDGGVRITARYYSLSDNSLCFAKVVMPDQKEYTLPQAGAASGVRYTDGMTMTWWTKGDTAFAEQCDQNGNWKTICDNCKEVK